jgi:hypothetical protein
MKKLKLITLALMLGFLSTGCEPEEEYDPYAVPPPLPRICGVVQEKGFYQDSRGNRTYYIKINGQERSISYEMYYNYSTDQGQTYCHGEY